MRSGKSPFPAGIAYGFLLLLILIASYFLAATSFADVMSTMSGTFSAIGIGTAVLLLIFALTVSLYTGNKNIALYRRALYYDSLTGLYNQSGFDLLAHENLLNDKQSYAILDFDINRFENFNTFYGYDAGDRVLTSIADILKDSCVKSELCARISSDRFLCLLRDEGVNGLTFRVEGLDAKLRALPTKTPLFFSYGVYRITDPTISVNAMCDRALVTKRMIKGMRDRIISFYDEDVYRQMSDKTELESLIPSALAEKEFIPFFQPQYDMQSRRIVGAEALVRWFRPDGTIIPPDQFIGIFEKTGLIIQLDMYMLAAVCDNLRTSIAAGYETVPVAVNFSRMHLYDESFPDNVAAVVATAGIPASLIHIELTESSVSDIPVDINAIIEQLHDRGFSVLLDDFGSGLSSLGLLKDIPDIDYIKLDRTFIDDNCASRNGRLILESILYAIERMDKKTIAEGIETQTQLDFLRKCGCDIAQGHLFSRALSADSYLSLMKAHTENPGSGLTDNRIKFMLQHGAAYSLLEAQSLLRSVSAYFAMIVSINLTQNTYHIMEQNHIIVGSLPEEGRFDDLSAFGASVMHPNSQFAYSLKFSRTSLLADYARGEKSVNMRSRWLQPSGVALMTETEVQFLDNPLSDDLTGVVFIRFVDVPEY